MVSRIVQTRSLSRFAPLLIGAFLVSSGDNVPAQTPAPTVYGVQGFGPATAASGATDVSDFGTPIVGHVRTSSGADRGAAWWYNGFRQLGTLGGAQSTALGAYFSVVVGQAQTASGQFHAFRSDIGTAGTPQLVDLGTLGGSASVAYATDYTNIVGSAQLTGNARWQAFIWTNGTMSALPIASQGNSSATDVVFGEVVGYSCASGNNNCRAFWIREGTVTTLPTLGGNTIANAINGFEKIAGTSALASGAQHAFLYDSGTMIDLRTLGGTNSEGLDINEAGHVVGVSDTAAGQQHAFLYRDGAMIDLNTLLPSGSGWVLQRANGISAAGQIVGVGTSNGVSRGFVLTPPADVRVWRGGQHSQSDSNLPRGVEVGRTIRFVNSITAAPDPLTVYGVKITATLSGPAEYQQVRSYDTDASECQLTAKTVTCNLLPIDTIGFGPEYQFTVKTTGPGAIVHSLTATSQIPDFEPGNNSLTEQNYAVALANLELAPASVPGGKASSARVTLTGLPPGGDAVVRLSSSRPDIAPVPATLIVPAHNNSPSRALNIIPSVVSLPTAVQITASYGLVTLTRTLTVVPPALTQLYLMPTTVIGGCGTSAGKVVLSGSAPIGGAVVSVTNTNSAATAPVTVTVPAGASSRTFTISTKRVTANVAGTVTVGFAGVSKALTLTVRPLRVKTLTLSPNPGTGGATSTASLVLECAAPAGGTVVSLASSNASIAAPAVSSIIIPAGATSATFTVRTSRVTGNTNVNVYATVYGTRKAAVVVVRP